MAVLDGIHMMSQSIALGSLRGDEWARLTCVRQSHWAAKMKRYKPLGDPVVYPLIICPVLLHLLFFGLVQKGLGF